MRYLLGIVIYLLGAGFFAYVKGFEAMLFYLPAILFILFALLAVLTIGQGFKVFGCGLYASLFPKKPLSDDIRDSAAVLFRLLSKTVALTSVLALIGGVMAAMFVLDDPVIFAHRLTSAFVAPFWGFLIIAAVLEPVVFIMKKRQSLEPATI